MTQTYVKIYNLETPPFLPRLALVETGKIDQYATSATWLRCVRAETGEAPARIVRGLRSRASECSRESAGPTLATAEWPGRRDAVRPTNDVPKLWEIAARFV
jgi:hypothetical protein